MKGVIISCLFLLIAAIALMSWTHTEGVKRLDVPVSIPRRTIEPMIEVPNRVDHFGSDELKDGFNAVGGSTRTSLAASGELHSSPTREPIRAPDKIRVPANWTNRPVQLKEDWANQGFGAPVNTVITYFWALREANSAVFLESMAVKEKGPWRRRIERLSEPAFRAECTNSVKTFRGIVLAHNEVVSPDWIIAIVRPQTSRPAGPELLSLRRFGDEWKIDGTIGKFKPHRGWVGDLGPEDVSFE